MLIIDVPRIDGCAAPQQFLAAGQFLAIYVLNDSRVY